MRSRRLTKILPALGLLALALPASASAQATRTWVSGVGDDANPCSRTAPCKTFAGAISKTANGGEINCLDPGGFGGVTITKSLTIKCHYTEGGALVSGTNGIVVNAAATDKVTIKGLDLNGIGTGAPTSLTGIKVLSAKRVNIVDTDIYRFKAGVAVVPTSAETRVKILRSEIHNNGVGVFNGPGNNLITTTRVTVSRSDIDDNDCGIVTSGFGANGSTPNSAVDCGASPLGAINKQAVTRIWRSDVTENTFGVFGRGATSITELAFSFVTGNTQFGLRRIDGAEMKTFTPATNVINNAASDAPTSTLPLTKRTTR